MEINSISECVKASDDACLSMVTAEGLSMSMCVLWASVQVLRASAVGELSFECK